MIFRTLGDGRYSLADAEHGIEFHIDRLRRERHELVGDLVVSCGILSSRAIDGVLSSGTFNFSNARWRDEWGGRLRARARTGAKIDWCGLLEEVSQRVIAAERDDGAAAVVLRHVPARPAAPMVDVLGLRFPLEHPSSFFGPGDSLKSYLMIRTANEQSRSGVRVGVFDWELDAYEHRARQARIDPELPDIIYIKCDRPLVHDIDRLRRIVRCERIEYGYFDSVAYGTAGKPEDAVAAMDYFRAFRQLGIGGNFIAHSRREDGEHQPFGSVFWHNTFRATWNIKRAATSDDGLTVKLGAFPRKFNLGSTPPVVGIEVVFDGDRVYFRNTDPASIDELAEGLPLCQRIRAVVRSGPQTLATIATELNYANVESLDRTVRRHKNLFTKVTDMDGITRIALVEKRA